jgi:4-diphosphocytidyl-2-C-methyl-D-erythritol kinase
VLAPAKINLWLNVVGRRADGYHLLDSLVAFTDLADVIEASPSDRLSLTVGGPFAATLVDEADNLVLKAARLLADRAGIAPRVALRLDKHIPVAAGLGGGSADAAAVLRVLIDLWRVALPVEELFDLAARLGADVPMCLAGRSALVSGVGERLAPAPPLPPCAILLVNPGTPLPTPEVFAHRQGAFSPVRAPRPWTGAASFAATLAEFGNDLTDAARALRPEISRVLDFLRTSEGVLHAAMSGSGATCFALYETSQLAERAAARVPPPWWSHAGTLVG